MFICNKVQTLVGSVQYTEQLQVRLLVMVGHWKCTVHWTVASEAVGWWWVIGSVQYTEQLQVRLIGDGGSSLSEIWRQSVEDGGIWVSCSTATGVELQGRAWLSWEWSVLWHNSGDTNTQATWSHPDLSEPGMEGQKMVLIWVIVEDWHPRHWDSVVLYWHLPVGTEEVMANCSQVRHRRLLQLWWEWCGGGGGEHLQCWVELQNFRFL